MAGEQEKPSNTVKNYDVDLLMMSRVNARNM
jgi:hypothetical protein